MTYETNTAAAISATNGTHLQGHVDTSYAHLVEVFGPHTEGDEYKVDAEWAILFEDGVVATIYNYKDGYNYLGAEGTPIAGIRDWHIGGLIPEVVARVEALLGEAPVG